MQFLKTGINHDPEPDPFTVCTMDVRLARSVHGNGRFVLVLETGTGAGPDGTVETVSRFNHAVVDHPGMLHSEGWYEHIFYNKKWLLRVGKIDLAGIFDANEAANDEYRQFLSSAFVNSPAIPWPLEHGPALVLQGNILSSLSAAFGLADASGSWNDAFSCGMALFEAHWRPPFLPEANYRILVWGREDENPKPEETTSLSGGLSLSLDQRLGRHFTLFGRFGHVTSEVLPVQQAASAGLRISEIPGRPRDHLGLALGHVRMQPTPAAEKDLEENASTRELHAEIQYSIGFDDHVFLTLDFQWNRRWNPGEDAWIRMAGGIRLRIIF